MKRTILERNIVVLMFVMVLVTFSFADRDTKKLERLYTHVVKGSDVWLTQLKINTQPSQLPEQGKN